MPPAAPVTTTPRSSRPAPILHAMALASIDATGSIVARGGSRPPVARGVARVESWYNHTRARQTRAPGKKTMADTNQKTGEERLTPTPLLGFGSRALVVERVETITLRAPLKRRYAGSAYAMVNRCTIVTRLFTRDGLASEVYTGDTDAEQERIVGIIRQELAPALLGRSATDPEGCWLAMQPATYDILRDRGLALQAIACLDAAIWDLFGKAIGLPLFRLWGACREALPIIVIGGYYGSDDAALAAELRGYAEAGFAGCKFKVG